MKTMIVPQADNTTEFYPRVVDRPRNIFVNGVPINEYMYCKRLASLEQLVAKLNKRLCKLEKK